MARQSAPIQEVARLLDLVPFLSTHSYISIKDLAQEFNVSEKEMINELSALSMCGLPGYTPYELIEVFFDSGFVTINNHEALDIPRALTNLEIASLLIGLSLMRESSNDHPELISRIESLTLQLSTLLGDVIEIESNPDVARTSEIESAIASRHSIDISYLSPTKDEIEVRRVDPLSLYQESSNTYLSAFCHKASGYRNFRVDRIVEISNPGNVNLADTLGETRSTSVDEVNFSDSSVSEVELQILGSRRSIAEFLSINSIPGDGRIDYQAFSPDWVNRAVVTFSPDIALQAPLEARSAVHQRLSGILALYQA